MYILDHKKLEWFTLQPKLFTAYHVDIRRGGKPRSDRNHSPDNGLLVGSLH
jgi:hypothetical protein